MNHSRTPPSQQDKDFFISGEGSRSCLYPKTAPFVEVQSSVSFCSTRLVLLGLKHIARRFGASFSAAAKLLFFYCFHRCVGAAPTVAPCIQSFVNKIWRGKKDVATENEAPNLRALCLSPYLVRLAEI